VSLTGQRRLGSTGLSSHHIRGRNAAALLQSWSQSHWRYALIYGRAGMLRPCTSGLAISHQDWGQ